MRNILFSDDPMKVRLCPERVKAARGLLNWSRADLARAVKVCPILVAEIRFFEDFGLAFDAIAEGAIKQVLLERVEFTLDDGEPGVCRKAHDRCPPGLVQLGGLVQRRAKL